MRIAIPPDQAAEFSRRFLDRYCAAGFGTLPKREIDLLVFRLLIDYGGLVSVDDAQSLSRQLRLPLTKIKSFLYELHLRDDGKDEAWVIAELSQRLRHSKPTMSGTVESARVEVGIDNQLLRIEVEALLKRDGHYPDYSFNREILRMTPKAYAVLIKAVLPDSECKDLLVLLKKAAKGTVEEKNADNWLAIAARKFIAHSAATFGDGVGDMSVEAFRAGVMALIEGGKQLFS
jgi:hypothetical protein